MSKVKAVVLIEVVIENVCDVQDMESLDTTDAVENMILDGDIDIYEKMEIKNVKLIKQE